MRPRLSDTIASIWTWTVLVLSVVITFPPILLWRIIGWPIDRWNHLGGRLFRGIAIPVVGLTPRWRFEISGEPPANPRNPYVVVANHESFADIILLSLLPWEMKWLSKIEIIRIPVFGWIMWAARDIPVHRGMAASARAAMVQCQRRLSGRTSVMIFPEGTRSTGSEMLPFKDGAFRLAIDAGVPILPIAVRGTRNAIQRRDWRIGSAHARALILEPIPTDGLGHADIRDLKARVRSAIDAGRDRLRRELEGEAAGG